MDTLRATRYIDQLRKRREEIAMTLRHLGKEQAEVESNTEWVNQAAYDKRVHLLARLFRWYAMEIDQIDKALARVKKNNYGRCVVCDELIEERQLDAAPASEFCRACRPSKNSRAEL
jgi:RNA polymerase-binding transcription factor DksA